MTIAFFRLLVAFAVLLPIGLRSAWKHRAIFLEYKIPFVVMTLTGITFFNMFIYGALQFTTSTKVSVLEAVIPAVTVVLSAFILRERLHRIQWSGVALSLIGAVWVIMNGKLFQLASVDWNVGDAIMVGAVISWAVYSIWVKRYMHLFPTYGVILVMTGISVILLFPFVLVEWAFTGIPPLGVPGHVAGLLYLGIFPSFIALIFYNRAVDLLSASEASVFLNFLPVFTMFGAYLWLGEKITVMQIIGALAVIGGVILTTQTPGVKRRSSPRDGRRSCH